MSSAFVKARLKAAREAIGQKDYEAARDASQGVLEYEPENYNARVFLGLSLLNLGQTDESEQAYRKAIEGNPSQLLAWQGLSRLHEQTGKWEDLIETLRHMAAMHSKADDATKCAEIVQKIIELRRDTDKSSPLQLADTLKLMLPDSPLYATLSSLPPPDPTNPTSTTTFLTQEAMQDSLPILEEIVTIHERDESTRVEKEVQKRRMRLGAAGPEQLRRQVEMEILETSPLPGLYDEILNHPNTSDELRRSTESKLLRLKQRHLHALPTTGAHASQKTTLAAEVDELVNGIVLLNIPDALAWSSFIESKDAATIEGYDYDILRRFSALFPTHPLAKLILAYFGYYGIPYTEGEAIADIHQVSREVQDKLVDIMTEAFAGLQESILSHRAMAEVYHGEEDWENAIKMAESGLELVQRAERNVGRLMPNVRKALNVVLATSLTEYFPPKHHARALGIIDDVLSQDHDNIPCLMSRAFILQRAEQWVEAEGVFAEVATLLSNDINTGIRAKEERAWCRAMQQDADGGAKALRDVLSVLDELEDHETDKARCWWRLGRCYWEMGDQNREEAYQYFITSLKRLPSFAPAFTSLGIYYADFLSPSDLARASKCFQKAFELDPREAEAARRLAEGFAEEREWDLVEVVARRTIEGEGGVQGGADAVAAARYLPVNAWAWKAVGVVELNRHNYSPAIQGFQIALRAHPDDQLSWLRLGEAYGKAGRYAAAVKALEHARELNPEDWIASYFIGEVQRQTGAYPEAIQAFQSILEKQPDELGVLMSLSQTFLDQGRVELAGAYMTRAEDSFVSSIRLVLQFMDANPGFRRVAWKIAADALNELSRFSIFSDREAVLRVGADVAVLVSNHSNSSLPAGIISSPLSLRNASEPAQFLLEVAIAAYDLRISSGSLNESAAASAHYDLGSALESLAHRTPFIPKQDKIHEEGVRRLKEAIRLDSANDLHWSALGNATFLSQPRLTQHAYIRALELDSKNPATWTNLGLFYFHHDDASLANEAFYKAQTLDPDYALAWVGQGLVATVNGHESEARALFEHAIGLTAVVPEADVEFAQRLFERVGTTPSSRVSSADALFPAFFVLDRFCKKQAQDPTALHLFGLVCERVGPTDLAIDMISRAITLLEAAYEESEDTTIERQFTIAHTNMARLRLSTQDYSGALESYQTAAGLLPDVPEDQQTRTLLTQCHFGSGIAHSKQGQLQEALGFFEAAMTAAADDATLRGHVVVLLAQTLWALGTDEGRETAKTQLLQSIESDPDNLAAINALAGMGILTDDDSLVDAALSEILGLPLEQRLLKDPGRAVTYLLVQHHLGQGDVVQALSVAQKAAFAEPSRPDIRRHLAQLALQQGDSATALAVIAGSSLSQEDNLAQSRESLALHATALSLSDRRSTDMSNEARKLAQKAVMLAPWETRNWQALAYVGSQSGR